MQAVSLSKSVLGNSIAKACSWLARDRVRPGAVRAARKTDENFLWKLYGARAMVSGAVCERNHVLNSLRNEFLVGRMSAATFGGSPVNEKTLASAVVNCTLERPSTSSQSAEAHDTMEEFVELGNKLADAAGQVIRRFFRTRFDVIDKNDMSPVTIADREAEAVMSLLIAQRFPTHGIYGEETGLQLPVEGTEYVWVLDPIDGTKSFITGKPLFGTLIALLHKGIPILGIIDQPVLHERWIGRRGKRTTLNGVLIGTRSSCTLLKNAYMYTTSPHLFEGAAEEAFERVRKKVKIPLYGCDCYAYGLLAAGHVDLVVESGLKPYDFLALVPVIEGAGGFMSDWHGQNLTWWPTPDHPSSGGAAEGVEVVAAGSSLLHKSALGALAWIR